MAKRMITTVDSESSNEYVARPYQVQLLDAALEQNTIILLGTGAGKTFIAVMLIKQLSAPTFLPLEDTEAKRSIFLVNTGQPGLDHTRSQHANETLSLLLLLFTIVPLVTQQSEYIQKHTGLEIGRYCGEMDVDSWNMDRWQHELRTHNVLVMTRQILLDALTHAFINIRQINLIVFDECHHAVKKDPYRRIMLEFYSKAPQHHRPHILGLSASIISGKCKPGELPERLKELEVTLDCRIETAPDLAEVAKYATNPDEVLQPYDTWPSDSPIWHLKQYINHILEFIDLSILGRANKKPMEKEIRAIIEECAVVLNDVGVTSAIEAAEIAKRELKELHEEYITEWQAGLVNMALTNITIFIRECRTVTTKYNIDNSNKMNALQEVLMEALENMKDKLCGIIFVQKRSTAVCLSACINKLMAGFGGRIRSDYVVGHGAIKKIAEQQETSSMNVKKQQLVLKRFRNEAINLLVATSVVEEGLDVRKCNLVVRYDFPLTFQSYIQSKGRARSKNSKYLLFTSREEEPENRRRLRDFARIEQELQEVCHNRTVPNEDELEQHLKELCPPFIPQGPNSPRLTIDGSLSLLHKYCQKLPHDQFTVSVPSFKIEIVKGGGYCFLDGEFYPTMFFVMVTFPMNCPVKLVVKGEPLPSSSLAKKVAALKAIKVLYAEGELDDHLKPIPHKEIDSDEEDTEKMNQKRKHKAGTIKRAMYYRNEIADCLRDCQPTGNASNSYLYVFMKKHKSDNGRGYYRAAQGQLTIQSLGILSGKPLPYHKIPEFSLYEGKDEITVTIFETKDLQVSNDELQLYKTFHTSLFHDVLKLPCSDFIPDDSCRGYLILPLTVELFETGNPVVFINTDMINHVIKHGENKGEPPTQPFRYSDFENALISKTYRTETGGRDLIQLYEVVRVDQTSTPLSPCEHDSSITYAQYFEKYNVQFRIADQFAIVCRRISNSEKILQLLSSRYNTLDTTDPARDEHTPVLFPEICNIHPLKADTLFLFRCIPSLVHRFESLLLVSEFMDNIVLNARLGLTPNFDLITTVTSVSAAQRQNYCESNSKVTFNYFNDAKPGVIMDAMAYPNVIRCPDTGLLLQALTPLSAKDCINLERLEVLGDSFLKLATSVNLFCSRNNHHEGKLSMARQRRVSNFNLWYLAKKRSIPGRIFSKKFEPLSSWVPPGCIFPMDQSDPLEVSHGILSEKKLHYMYHRVSDKGVADAMEAILGACIVAGGLEAGFRFFEFIDLKMDREECSMDGGSVCQDVHMTNSASQESLMSIENLDLTAIPPLLIQNSGYIFSCYCHSPPSSIINTQQPSDHQQGLDPSDHGKGLDPSDHGKGLDPPDHILSKIALQCTTLLKKLDWQFQDNGLLLQALTHPSYTKNNITECYQRLEFLGDAVLDYLITCYIYEHFPGYSPGKITEMRSALVNNVTFAEIAVKELELHKHVLHCSPSLFNQISEYTNWIEMVWCKSDDEIKSVDLCLSMSNTEGKNIPAQSLEASAEIIQDTSYDEIEDIEPPKILGDLLESIAGAVFLDSGMSLQQVWLTFCPFFKPLIEKYSNNGLPIPPVKELYDTNLSIEMDTESVSDIGKRYRCTIKVVDKGIQVTAIGKTKKQAQKSAARRALEILNKIKV